MLVTRILGGCPRCARSDAFGNVDVFGSVLVRGCGYCEYREEIPLPPIHKKSTATCTMRSSWISRWRRSSRNTGGAKSASDDVLEAATERLGHSDAAIYEPRVSTHAREGETVAVI